jgi:hypothetical protein
MAAFCSAWLVMICLGARSASQHGLHRRISSADIMRHLLGVYLLPLLVLTGLFCADVLRPAVFTGLALCVTSGSGTSGAALVAMAGGQQARAAALLLLSTLASIVFMPATLLLLTGKTDLLRVAGLAALVCLLFQLLPFLLGRFFLVRRLWWPHWDVRLERMANLAVTLLILLVVVQQLPAVWREPGLLGAGSLLAFSFWAGSRLSGAAGTPGEHLELMAIIRNLTGVLVVLPVLAQGSEAFKAIPAFGVPMYALSALLVWTARRQSVAANRGRVPVRK